MASNQNAAGWPTKPLIDCTSDGNISYGIVQPGQHTENGIPIIRVNNFKSGVLDDSDVLRVSKSIEDNYRRTRLQGGEVLLTLVGSVGQTAIVSGDLAGWNVARAIAVIRPSEEVSAKWLTICLQSADARHFLDGRANTTVQKTLNLGDVKQVPIPIPPKEVRYQIESMVTSIDDKIDLNRRINQTLEAMAQAIFKSWFVDFDPVKAKITAIAEGRDPLRAAMSAISGKSDAELDTLPPEAFEQLAATAALFPDQMEESELGEIPKGWMTGTFKHCCLRVESGGTPSRKESAFWGGSIPWLTSGEVRDVVVLDTKEKITREGLDSSSAKLWPPMTTVVAMYGATAGQVCLTAEKMAANQACCALIPKSEFTAFIFIAARQSIQQLAEKASGSAQQNLNKSLVENHVHIVPCKEIAERFEKATSGLLQQWILNQRKATTLGMLRDTLLPELLSGKLSATEAMAEAES